MNYELIADELTRRIVGLGPQILALSSPWGLFKIEGFQCDDLNPSLAQASWSLQRAKQIVKEND